ncbi:DUF4962 domain-containing protein [Paenibacillus sp. J5C_2022]|uniref:DUF4962 domain-containing protein n=1 Tax=Paenibacillus sp. J5C2022 TaxID=2977129 RepID=UPI0021CE3D67|nr:DUF4962 domain-containing protein [Paenibacillus sp. J5C2022]MCU6712568.1 DUF4962 domain-containing protein [Paenibacillus sp. J5C2022]
MDEVNGYRLQVSRQEDFCEVIYECEYLGVNYYNFPFAFQSGTWYWRVSPINENEQWVWSTPRKFRINQEAVPFPVPLVEEIMDSIPDSHPRIWATSDRLEEFRSFVNGKGKSIYEKTLHAVMSRMEEGLTPEPTFNYPPGYVPDEQWIEDCNRLKKEAIGSTRKMQETALIYFVSGDVSMGLHAKKQLLHIADWDPAGATSYQIDHQVHRAIAYRSAIVFDWLYDLLSQDEKQFVLATLKVRTETMLGDLSGSGIPITENPYDSHGWTAFGYIGIIAVALLGEIPEAELWFKQVVPAYINLLPPWGGEDGGWAQGTGYWQVSSFMNKEMMDVLLYASGFNLYDKAHARNEGRYPLYAYPHGSPTGVFGDENDIKPNGYNVSLLRRIAEMQGDARLQWAWKALGQSPLNVMFDYFYGDDSLTPIPPYDWPKAIWFQDIGWVAMHSELYDPLRVSLYFKSSRYGSYNHSHADQNSFIIHAYGEDLAIDSGWYDWYGSTHHEKFTRQTLAHNAITLNGGVGQPVHDMEASGTVTGFVTHPLFDAASGDALAAYEGSLDQAERHILYIRPNLFVIIDRLRCTDDTDAVFEWRLHAAEQLIIDEDAKGARIHKGHAGLNVKLHYPEQWQASVEEKYKDQQGKEVRPEGRFAHQPDQLHATFMTPQSGKTMIVSTLEPHRIGEIPHRVRCENDGNFLHLTLKDRTSVYIRLAEEGLVTADRYQFDAVALVVHSSGGVMLLRGTKLFLDGHVLIESDSICTVAIDDEDLAASCLEEWELRIYRPNLKKIKRMNGVDVEAGDATREQLMMSGVQCEPIVEQSSANQVKGARLTMEGGAHTFRLNAAPTSAEGPDVELKVSIDGVMQKVRMRSAIDLYGRQLSWGSLTNEEGEYRIIDAPVGLLFDVCGRQENVVLPQNASFVVYEEPRQIVLEKIIHQPENKKQG